jgi:transposase
MDQFPSASHLASWAGLCPGNHESAGKRKSGKTRKGSDILRATFMECAKSSGHLKNTYFSSQYNRIAARRGKNRATVAVAHEGPLRGTPIHTGGFMDYVKLLAYGTSCAK